MLLKKTIYLQFAKLKFVEMKIFRKLIFVISTAAMAVSCLNGPQNEEKFGLSASFEYSGSVAFTDSVAFSKATPTGIGWYHLAFCHKLSEDENPAFLGGFILSKMFTRTEPIVADLPSEDNPSEDNPSTEPAEDTPTQTEELEFSPYRVYTPEQKMSNTYAVFCDNGDEEMMPESDVIFLSKEYGTCTLYGCHVANTEEVVKSIVNTFEKGDYLKLIAKGYLDGELTEEVEIKLAEYSADKDSIVTSWTTFTLDKLGSVDKVDFELQSSKEGIPSSFCMDNFTVQVHLKY